LMSTCNAMRVIIRKQATATENISTRNVHEQQRKA
jgi:hypothetical protein